MKKTFALFALIFALSPLLLIADVGEGTATSTFRGIITAVETERDSFTVESADKQVKMFAVTPERKGSLEVGTEVTVGYTENQQWPLQPTSISGGSSSR
jgi:hypothetical protein